MARVIDYDLSRGLKLKVKAALRVISSVLFWITTFAACARDPCIVTSPEQLASSPDTCRAIGVAAWPSDDLVIEARHPDQNLSLGHSVFFDSVDLSLKLLPDELSFRSVEVRGFKEVAGRVLVSESVTLEEFERTMLAMPDAPDILLKPRIIGADECYVGPGLSPWRRIDIEVRSSLHLRIEGDDPHPCLSFIFFGPAYGGQEDWASFVLDVDHAVQPNRELRVSITEWTTLDHLKPLGGLAENLTIVPLGREIKGPTGTALLAQYADWLDSVEFSGAVSHCSVDDTTYQEVCGEGWPVFE
jgi:hypothetical protein